MCVLPYGQRGCAGYGTAHCRLPADGAAVCLAWGGEGSTDRGGTAAAVGPGRDGARAGGDAHGLSAGWDLRWRGVRWRDVRWQDGAEGSAAGYCVDHKWPSAGGAGAAVEGCGVEPRDGQHGCGGCGDICGDYAGSAKLRQGDGRDTQGAGRGAGSGEGELRIAARVQRWADRTIRGVLAA